MGWWSDLIGTFSNAFRIGSKATIDASGLSAARTFTLPDASGTISLGGGGGSVLQQMFFGDGSYGARTVSADESELTEKSYSNLTIDAGDTFFPNGFLIRCSGTLTVNGAISSSGSDGISPGNGVGGIAWGANNLQYLGGIGGTDGTFGAGMVGPGADYAPSGSIAVMNEAAAPTGGAGGNGVGAESGSGYSGGTDSSTTYAIQRGMQWLLDPRILPVRWPAGYSDPLGIFAGKGGLGGGSGAGSSPGYGGNGGGGGGLVYIAAKNIVIGASGSIRADGGDGQDGTAAAGDECGGGGGGGGGNGGVIVLIYETLSIASGGAITVNGGSGGDGGAGGADIGNGTGGGGSGGSNGTNGVVIKYNLTTGEFE